MNTTWSRFNLTSVILGFAFLYLPIVLLVIFSFNEDADFADSDISAFRKEINFNEDAEFKFNKLSNKYRMQFPKVKLLLRIDYSEYSFPLSSISCLRSKLILVSCSCKEAVTLKL